MDFSLHRGIGNSNARQKKRVTDKKAKKQKIY